MRVGDQQIVVIIVVATDFRALYHEPGSVGEIMKELFISPNHFLGSSLWSLYQILADPLAVPVTPR